MGESDGRVDHRDSLKKMRVLIRLLRAVLLALAVVVVGLIVFRNPIERRMVYAPARDLWTSPASVHLTYTDVTMTAADGVRLHAWHVQTGMPRAIVLLLHGNAGNIADRVPHAEAFARAGMDTLLLDYRGYGRSDGSPSENGLYLDAAAAFQWAARRRLPTIIYGESLGGAIAIETATRHPPAALVIQSTFTSLSEMASLIVPFGRWLVSERFSSLDKVPQLTVPTLVVHGDRDELIPHTMGKRLFDAIRSPKAMLTVVGGGHNDVFALAGADIAHGTARLLR